MQAKITEMHAPRIEIERPGPLEVGDVQIGGGLSLWITVVALRWKRQYEDFWVLSITVETLLPDRFSPTASPLLNPLKSTSTRNSLWT